MRWFGAEMSRVAMSNDSSDVEQSVNIWASIWTGGAGVAHLTFNQWVEGSNPSRFN